MQPKTIVRVEAEEPAKRLAVLIDADNAQAAVIEALLEEVARFGEATVRRIYGDFTSPSSSSWKKVLNRPLHQTCSAVRLYNGQECDRQHDDHRRNGSSIHPQI
jgi:hypothetical protein